MYFRGSVGTFGVMFSARIVSIGEEILVNKTDSVLSFKASSDADTIFGTIFIIIWGGASVLTLNAKFLGAEM